MREHLIWGVWAREESALFRKTSARQRPAPLAQYGSGTVSKNALGRAEGWLEAEFAL
ncbi:MAG: hypothetical protein KF716_22190 [Anaerolineae bacterium]|nr:hypothetical protein [Anaerolineae bacterium]